MYLRKQLCDTYIHFREIILTNKNVNYSDKHFGLLFLRCICSEQRIHNVDTIDRHAGKCVHAAGVMNVSPLLALSAASVVEHGLWFRDQFGCFENHGFIARVWQIVIVSKATVATRPKAFV